MAINDRKIAILGAVVELLAKKGLDGVTHRAVDLAAELPQGSTSYHYPKKVQLLMGAADHLIELLGKDCEELQVGFAECVSGQGLDAAIAYVGDELVSYADRSRSLFLARMELTLASARREDLVGIGERLTAAARRPIAFFLKLMPGEKTNVSVETCAGLIDGITLMYATGQGPKPTSDQLKTVFAAVVSDTKTTI